jgi:hypothetical protein
MELALVAERGDRRLVLHSPRIVAQPGREGAPNRKVAALAPFVRGWVVAPLVDDPVVFLNGSHISEPRLLQAGDALEVLDFGSFIVELAQVEPADDDALLGLAGPECRVEVRLEGEVLGEVQVEGKGLIGSDDRCEVAIEDKSLEPQHALLVHHEGYWRLLDLSGRRLARLGSKPVRQLLLLSGDSVWLSSDLEVTFHFENKDLLDLPQAAAPPPRAEPEPDEATAPEPATTDSTPSQPASPESTVRTVVVTGDRLTDPVCQRALKLCQWVQLQLANSQRNSAESRPAPMAWLPRRHNPVAELDRYQELLAPNPRNVRIIQELAHYLMDLGITDIARIILKEIVRYFPKETDPLNDLAQLFFEQGNDSSLPQAERLEDLRRGRKYIEKAIFLCPENVRFMDLRRKIDASIYVLEHEDD